MAVLDPNEVMFTSFEPKVQNRFILYVDGIPSYMVNKFTAPSFDEGEITIEHINTYFKLAGKRRWQNITMELYDPVTPSGTQAVMEWCRLRMESVTGRAGYSDFYKKDITLNVLGPVGDIIGEWIIKGAWPKTPKFGDFDWSQDAPVQLTMEIVYDYAVSNF